MRNFMIAALAGVVLTACAQTATQADIQNADYGRAITQNECETIARREITSALKDPASAQISFGQCTKQALRSVPILGVPKQFGYYVVASVNAKNSFGGYTGAQNWAYLIKDGQAIRRLKPSDGFLIPY